jgi:hypothetical protein
VNRPAMVARDQRQAARRRRGLSPSPWRRERELDEIRCGPPVERGSCLDFP